MFNIKEQTSLFLERKDVINGYEIKEVATYKLPIISHAVVVELQARQQLTLFEKMVIKMLYAGDQKKMTIDELVQMIGLSETQLHPIISKLVEDQVLSSTHNVIQLTESGQLSVKDYYSPNKKIYKQFHFYYEPMTGFLTIEEKSLLEHESLQIHSLVHTDYYDETYCPFLEEQSIAQLWDSLYEQPFDYRMLDVEIVKIVVKSERTLKSLPIKQFQLFSKSDFQQKYAIWNEWNNQNIRFIEEHS